MDPATAIGISRIRELQRERGGRYQPSAPLNCQQAWLERHRTSDDNHIDRIRRLQKRRGRTEEWSIEPIVISFQKVTRRAFKKFGRLAQCWGRHIPKEISEHTGFWRFRSGVLEVTTDSASIAFELDRELRAGAFAAIQRDYPGSLTRIRLRRGDVIEKIAT